MKNITLTLLFVFITSLGFANDNINADDINKSLRNKIETLLGNYQEVINADAEASVKFIINRAGQIVVLSVATKEQNLETYIKMKLNYKETSVKNVKFLETYTVPVKFIKK